MKRIYIVILLYVLCMFAIFRYKPAMIFDGDGNLKRFDYDSDNLRTSGTLFNIEIVLAVLAVFCYLVVLSLEMVFI